MCCSAALAQRPHRYHCKEQHRPAWEVSRFDSRNAELPEETGFRQGAISDGEAYAYWLARGVLRLLRVAHLAQRLPIGVAHRRRAGRRLLRRLDPRIEVRMTGQEFRQ